MKRLLIVLILLLTFVAILAACGDAEDTTAAETGDTATTSTTDSVFVTTSAVTSITAETTTATTTTTAEITTTAEVTTTAPITYTAKSFMGAIDDKTPLSAIVLPGTHDSGATKEFKLAGVAVAGTAKCQTLSISEQLAIGVRFFDIRLRRVNGSLHVYHGEVDQELSFDAVLAAFYGFLEENPSEALIVSIKEECDPEGDNAAFDQMVREVLAKARERWYLGSDIPTLGAVRGKCVLMRRFGTSGSYGFDASSGWADNTTFTITRGAYKLEVQDYYQNEAPEGKWDAFAAFCEKMQEKTARSYYLNYSSGNIQNFLGIPSITKVSDHMNPKLLTYLATKPDLVGVFVTDFVTEELAKAIYELNFN